MEGPLLVPPDRGTIIGRALWKPRWVVLGPSTTQPQTPPQIQPPPFLPRTLSTGRLQAARSAIRNVSAVQYGSEEIPNQNDQLWLTVYKAKGDEEPVWQYPITSIKSCEIQSLQYRKPGPTLPTLVITLHQDVASEKQRKRRSSRSSALSSSSSSSDSIYFRTVPDDQFNIFDWQVCLQARIRPTTAESFHLTKSPTSPTFNGFINPFASKGNTSDRDRRLKSSAEMEDRPGLRYHGSGQMYTSAQSTPQHNERPSTSTLISPSPSLRSRRSDLSSSQASSFNHKGGRNNISLPIQTHGPNDLPSPAPTSFGYGEDQFISGWTSAQGRSSALSSHTRGSNSVVSMGSTPPQPVIPIAPRETILDRAFTLRYIPGSEKVNPGDDAEGSKLSSIARFEALMREAEEKKRSAAQGTRSERGRSRYERQTEDSRKDSANGWEESDDNENENGKEMKDEDASDGESYIRQGVPEPRSRNGPAFHDSEDDELALSAHDISSSAQRALEYISGRSASSTTSERRPISPPSAKSQAAPFPLSDRPLLHITSRREEDRRSQITLPPTSNPAPESNSHPEPPSSYHQPFHPHQHAQPPALDRRSSTKSTKRLSFTDFAKRLSSTSSLLLVQTNASSSTNVSSRNSRGSSSEVLDDDTLTMGSLQRGLSQSRLSGMGAGYHHAHHHGSSRHRDGSASATTPGGNVPGSQEACVWRATGAVGGGLGGEGGFL